MNVGYQYHTAAQDRAEIKLDPREYIRHEARRHAEHYRRMAASIEAAGGADHNYLDGKAVAFAEVVRWIEQIQE